MKVVVVGAGAVGQVYGHHLARGGAEVVFRVRRPDAVRRPFVIHDLNRGTTARFDAAVVGSDAEVAAFGPDVVLLTVPSDALRGPWLAELLAAAGNALVVSLEPGVEEARLIHDAAPHLRLAQGLISLIAYQAPLPGETRFSEPGIAVWYPWIGGCPFAGPDVAPFAAALAAGGLRTSVRPDLADEAAFGSILFATWVTVLKAAGWSFARLGEVGPLGARAVRQALAVASARVGRPIPGWTGAVGPWSVRVILGLGAWVLPLPLELYLRVHFTKVGAQTRLHLSEAIAQGRERGMAVDAVEELLDRADAAARAVAPDPG